MKKKEQNITLNSKDRHLQKFSYINLLKIFENANLKIYQQKNGPVFGGPIIERT